MSEFLKKAWSKIKTGVAYAVKALAWCVRGIRTVGEVINTWKPTVAFILGAIVMFTGVGVYERLKGPMGMFRMYAEQALMSPAPDLAPPANVKPVKVVKPKRQNVAPANHKSG